MSRQGTSGEETTRGPGQESAAAIVPTEVGKGQTSSREVTWRVRRMVMAAALQGPPLRRQG